MSITPNSIAEALAAGQFAETTEAIEGLSAEECRNVEEAVMGLPEEKLAEFSRHLKAGYVSFANEAGEKSLLPIKRDVQPMSHLFSEYASRQKLRLDTLRFSLNGWILDTDCSMTAEQLGMDAGNDVIHVRVVAPSPTLFTTISFVDEVGTKLDFDAHPHLQLYRLFQTYSAMRGMGLVWALLQFRCKGNPPENKNCTETLSQLEMTGGNVVYVSLQRPSREEIQAFAQLAQIDHPHSFVNCRVADDHKPSGADVVCLDESGEGGLSSEEFGTVVSYSGHGGDNTIWTAEYPNNVTKQYTRDELVDCMTTYYIEKNGFDRDILAHLEQQAERLQSEMSSLEQREGADVDASILHALKIEQEIEQMQKLARPSSLPGFRGIVAEQTLELLTFNLGEVRRALVVDGIKSTANKPMLMAGETVYAKRWPADNGTPSWKRGTIESFQCFDEDASGYGPRRAYCVTFDDGDVQNDISEDQVAYESEHRTKREFSETKWNGVERRLNTGSTDPWASKVGWYVAKIEGIEQPFTYLFDALRAYDAQTVAWEGADTEEEQLNNIPSDGWHIILESLCGGGNRGNDRVHVNRSSEL